MGRPSISLPSSAACASLSGGEVKEKEDDGWYCRLEFRGNTLHLSRHGTRQKQSLLASWCSSREGCKHRERLQIYRRIANMIELMRGSAKSSDIVQNLSMACRISSARTRKEMFFTRREVVISLLRADDLRSSRSSPPRSSYLSARW